MALGLRRFDDARLYKEINCMKAKSPSIANCIYDEVTLSCGSTVKLMRDKFHPGGQVDETVEEGVTEFYNRGKKIPYEIRNSTSGTINVKSDCRCSLCLFDPSWFYCHCSKCLPSQGFQDDPDPLYCPYLVHVPGSTVYVFRNTTQITKGWNHQLDMFYDKCCCIFHPCPENNKTPCLCKRCVLDWDCECVACGGACNQCGEKSAVDKAREEIPCSHTKCAPGKINLDWMPSHKRHPTFIA